MARTNLKAIVLKVLIYGAFILLAPFAIELVIMADIIGIEAAMAFLFVYGRSVAIMLRERINLAYNLLVCVLRAQPGDDYFSHRAFAWGAGLSMAALWISGSALVALATWTPIMWMANQQI
ncbi:MAG: hypothetical protein AAF513_10160 [Pseudomonadota bacterium]